MKIKISDLVNKVINREEMPKEVLFDGNIYKWCQDIEDYRKEGWRSCLMIKDIFFNIERYGSFYNMLFEEVEIIEEPKKIEKIEMVGCNVRIPVLNNELVGTDTSLALETTIVKVNELIDEINNLKEKQ